MIHVIPPSLHEPGGARMMKLQTRTAAENTIDSNPQPKQTNKQQMEWKQGERKTRGTKRTTPPPPPPPNPAV